MCLTEFEREAILKIPHVEELKETDKSIILKLKSMICQYRLDHQDNMQLEQCRVLLRTDGGHGIIKIYELNANEGFSGMIWPRGSGRHPHVYYSGTPCLGNIKHHFYKLVREKEYAVAINLIIQFLQASDVPVRSTED